MSFSDQRKDRTPWQPLIVGWSDYSPFWQDVSNFNVIPGTGGYCIGRYSMIAAFTMAIRINILWGSAAGNGGNGAHHFSLPPGYVSGVGTQLLTTETGQIGSGNGVGFGYVAGGQTGIRPFGYASAGSATLVQWGTAGAGVGPTGWYPNGNGTVQGTLEVAQQW